MRQIGFIGLGNMGAGMASVLRKAGYVLRCFDVDPAKLKAAANSDEAMPSIDACVSDVDVVITTLPNGAIVADVYRGPDGILAHAAKDALLIDCSTIDVATSRAMADEAARAGFDMLDAPVSGGVMGAAAGTLTFMVGGPEAAFIRARTLFDAMGKTVVHTGASGAGQAAKICNNMILGVTMIATSEAFALADQLGLDRQKLFDVSSTASGQSWSLTTYCPVPGPVPSSPANHDYAPGFTADMMLKDLRLAQEAAKAFGAKTPLGQQAAALYETLCASGAGGRDFSFIFDMLSARDGDS